MNQKLIDVRNWYLTQIHNIPKGNDWEDYSRQCRVIFSTALSKARAVSQVENLKLSDRELTDFLQRG